MPTPTDTPRLRPKIRVSTLQSLAAGALVLMVAACAPTKVRSVEADARRIADELGKQLGKLFVRHGWITEREAR